MNKLEKASVWEKFMDRFSNDKTIVIRFQYENGKFLDFYSKEEIPLIERAVGEITVLESFLLKNSKSLQYNKKKTVQFLPKNSEVLVGLKPPVSLMRDPEAKGHEPPEKLRKLIPSDKIHWRTIEPPGSHLAEIILLEDLKIVLRGTKKAILEPCECKIPVLERTAQSLNHAYTLLSQEFETDRLSHTGNVFTKVFFESSKGKWSPLESLRGQLNKFK